MAAFDPDTLRDLRDLDEVAIRTRQHPETAVVIWSVVSAGALFVRSVRGPKGRWHRDVTAEPHVLLEFSGRRMEVQAIPVTESRSIECVSGEYLRKYRTSPYVRSVVAPGALATTLRLVPT